jgi:hypothetical protein
MSEGADMETSSPEHRKIDGSHEYEEALDTLLARAQRTLRIFDRQLGTAYNSPRRCELLRKFLLSSRANRLFVVVHDASGLDRDCPRVLNLLRQFPHAVTVHETEVQAKRACDPIALADGRDSLHRFHYDDTRALLALDDPQSASGLLQRFEEIWEASVPAVTATTLGL